MTIALERGTTRGVLALLRKDLRVFDTRDAAVTLVLYVIVGAQVARWDEAFFWAGVGLAAALIVIVPFVEWLLEADRLLGSLPVGRDTIVLARYASALVACGVAAAVWMAGGRVLTPLLAPPRATPALWETADGVLLFLVATTGLAAVFLPLYYRLALGRAAIVFAPLAALLAAVGSGIVRRAVTTAVADLGAAAAVALVGAGLTALLSASCWISVKAYDRRDL